MNSRLIDYKTMWHAFVVKLQLGDRPTTEGETIGMWGDNVSAVS